MIQKTVRCFTTDLVSRDKASLDIFWLKVGSLPELDKLLAPEVIAAEIVEDLEVALEKFREIMGDMAAGDSEAIS